MNDNDVNRAVAKERSRLDQLIEAREERLQREVADFRRGRGSISLTSDFQLRIGSNLPVANVRAQRERVARPKNRRLYFAYGSNLDKSQMQSRCPDAVELYPHNLFGWRLQFQNYATIVRSSENDYVPGAIFLIYPEEEESLDIFEGVRNGSYVKDTFSFYTPKGNWRDVLYYVKPGQPIEPPTKRYLERILRGYNRLGLDKSKLKAALVEASTTGGRSDE